MHTCPLFWRKREQIIKFKWMRLQHAAYKITLNKKKNNFSSDEVKMKFSGTWLAFFFLLLILTSKSPAMTLYIYIYIYIYIFTEKYYCKSILITLKRNITSVVHCNKFKIMNKGIEYKPHITYFLDMYVWIYIHEIFIKSEDRYIYACLYVYAYIFVWSI